MLKRKAKAVVVKEITEHEHAEHITAKQRQMVWHKDVGGCGLSRFP